MRNDLPLDTKQIHSREYIWQGTPLALVWRVQYVINLRSILHDESDKLFEPPHPPDPPKSWGPALSRTLQNCQPVMNYKTFSPWSKEYLFLLAFYIVMYFHTGLRITLSMYVVIELWKILFILSVWLLRGSTYRLVLQLASFLVFPYPSFPLFSFSLFSPSSHHIYLHTTHPSLADTLSLYTWT